MRFLKDVRAAEFSEVALVLALVIVVAIGAYSLLGGNISQIITEVAGSL